MSIRYKASSSDYTCRLLEKRSHFAASLVFASLPQAVRTPQLHYSLRVSIHPFFTTFWYQ